MISFRIEFRRWRKRARSGHGRILPPATLQLFVLAARKQHRRWTAGLRNRRTAAATLPQSHPPGQREQQRRSGPAPSHYSAQFEFADGIPRSAAAQEVPEKQRPLGRRSQRGWSSLRDHIGGFRRRTQSSNEQLRLSVWSFDGCAELWSARQQQ